MKHVKICGMRESENIRAVAALGPDLLGFIFSEQSARFVRGALDGAALRALPPHVGRVGVFVAADLAEIVRTAAEFNLDYVQLHGHETPEFCQEVRAQNLRVIKAFAVDGDFDFSILDAYAPNCDYFLFDTKGELPGGNGRAFDWSVLHRYDGPVPFWLSGGLGPANLAAALRFEHPRLHGFDFNSKLEIAPGVKDVAAVERVMRHFQEPGLAPFGKLPQRSAEV